MLRKISLMFNTVKHLKLTQIKHQVKYRLKKAGQLGSYNKIYNADELRFLSFKKLPPVYKTFLGNDSFNFLNIQVNFKSEIDWNFQEHGKLWNYNLQYANYLLQEGVSTTDKVRLIKSLYASLLSGKLPIEPYPVSLRSINVIRFCSLYQIKDPGILENLHGELDFLSKRPEYHILGNHLLENAFALIMGGAFFSESTWLKQGKEILIEQLTEQILSDGAHFELSPMYHQIILFRVLELIDWYSNWSGKEEYFQKFLFYKVEMMCAWLSQMTFKNGDIPHFNDSANGIAYSTKWLLDYAELLNVKKSPLSLSTSGYRAIDRGAYECKVDFGQVGPTYQPGHAHADALSFILYYKGEPLFVERGTSTYQIGKIRDIERSTAAHNTVTVNLQNQSNVWGGFRVAERATVQILKDGESEISAQHDGYRKHGMIHKRSFSFYDNSIEIIDDLGENNKSKEFHIHIHPGLDVDIDYFKVIIANKAIIEFKNATGIIGTTYEMADGYNQYRTGEKIVVTFKDVLNTKITLNK